MAQPNLALRLVPAVDDAGKLYTESSYGHARLWVEQSRAGKGRHGTGVAYRYPSRRLT